MKNHPSSENLENPIVFDDSWVHTPYGKSENHYSPVNGGGWRATDEECVDDLFCGLDGLAIVSGRETWILAIVGIHAKGDDKWIQVSLDGPTTSEHLVIHLKPRATVEDMLARIRTWIAAPSRSDHVLRVG